MTINDKPHNFYHVAMRGVATLVAVSLLVIVSLTGCTSPPSVTPLLRITQRAIVDESQHLADDAQRDHAQVEQVRKALSAAFDADLRDAPELSSDWVHDATAAYVAAREALLRHELALQNERAQRAGNLDAAGRALDRAVSLIEQQDKLITRVTGVNLWKFIDAPAAHVPLRGDR